MNYLITLLLLFYSCFFFSQSDHVFLLDRWTTSGLPLTSDGESVFNEVWGFVQYGKEYAVLGSTKGTHIFQISDDDELILVDFVQGKYSGTQAVHRDYPSLILNPLFKAEYFISIWKAYPINQILSRSIFSKTVLL